MAAASAPRPTTHPPEIGVGINFSHILHYFTVERGLEESHASWVRQRLQSDWALRPIQTLPSCLQGEMPSSSSTEQSNDGKLHVALFDDRPEPNVRAMMGFVRMLRHVTIGGSMTFHAILAQQRTLPGIRVTSLRDAVPDRVRCIMSGMARLLTSRRGKRMQGVLYKVMLHWLLPDVNRIVLLDSDLVPLRDLAELKGAFHLMRRSGALFGLAPEQSEFYSSGRHMPQGVPGYNTGVWLMDLHAMRRSGWYSWLLDAYQAGYLFQKLGVVPDQNFVNGVVGLSPNLVHPLGCGWNRQLTSWFLGTNGALIKPNAFRQKRLNTVLNCPETCGMLHFNGDVVKCMVPLLQQANGSCSTWHALIRDIPATTNEQMSNPSACLLRRVFGGEDLPNQTTRSAKHDGQIVRAVFQFFGKCCIPST